MRETKMIDHKRLIHPKHSPWGVIQDCEQIADGILAVSTAGHGGIKLDRKRNAQVPELFRTKGGWYEEDCEWAIAATIHRDAFLEEARQTSKCPDTLSAAIDSTCKNYFPDFFTAFTGKVVTAAESYVIRKRESATKNATNLVVIAAWGDWHDDVPEGMVGVKATLGGKRGYWSPEEGKVDVEDHNFLVPKEEYDTRDEFGFVIDPLK